MLVRYVFVSVLVLLVTRIPSKRFQSTAATSTTLCTSPRRRFACIYIPTTLQHTTTIPVEYDPKEKSTEFIGGLYVCGSNGLRALGKTYASGCPLDLAITWLNANFTLRLPSWSSSFIFRTRLIFFHFFLRELVTIVRNTRWYYRIVYIEKKFLMVRETFENRQLPCSDAEGNFL